MCVLAGHTQKTVPLVIITHLTRARGASPPGLGPLVAVVVVLCPPVGPQLVWSFRFRYVWFVSGSRLLAPLELINCPSPPITQISTKMQASSSNAPPCTRPVMPLDRFVAAVSIAVQLETFWLSIQHVKFIRLICQVAGPKALNVDLFRAVALISQVPTTGTSTLTTVRKKTITKNMVTAPSGPDGQPAFQLQREGAFAAGRDSSVRFRGGVQDGSSRGKVQREG